VPINYVGHAEQWDEVSIDGDIQAKDCLLKYEVVLPPKKEFENLCAASSSHQASKCWGPRSWSGSVALSRSAKLGVFCSARIEV
jgi:hypothetical protein